MKVKCLNNSSIKTKELIRKEFANQIQKKGELTKVSVTELTNNIGISRGTFYSHYDKIDDVAKEFQNEALEFVKQDLKNINDVNIFLDKITLFLKNNNDLYSIILKANDPMIFMERLNKIANIKLTDLLNRKYNYNELTLDISVFIDGIINLYIKYFRGDINYTLDEINNYSKKLFNFMFQKKINCI